MDRRDFLKIGTTGVIGVGVSLRDRSVFAATNTVLYDDRAVVLAVRDLPVHQPEALWIHALDLPSINGFEIKPEGACRADICIPLPDDMTRGEYFNLTAFAKKIGQVVVVDKDAGVWSLGEIPAFRSGLLSSRIAPNFAVPNQKGQLIRLSDFLGKKVLLVTWASWCGCRFDLPHWQKLYEELKSKNFEIILVAEDTGGEAVTARWYKGAQVTCTALVDPSHAVSSAFDFVNVPAGVWIDEEGRVARPGEPAWATDNKYEFGDKVILTEGTRYVEAVRNWVDNGVKSPYVLSDVEFAKRVQAPSMVAMEADAVFKLAVWFRQVGEQTKAQGYFQRAQQLDPDNWNYHRQDWSFRSDGGQQWMKKFQQLDEDYYPKLKLLLGQ